MLTRDGFYVTVEGRGVGWLSCEGIRRWVFGSFCETFLLNNPTSTPTSIVVNGVGVSGKHQAAVLVTGRVALRAPQTSAKTGFLKPFGLPKPRTLRVKAPTPGNFVPRLKERWRAFVGEQSLHRDET